MKRKIFFIISILFLTFNIKSQIVFNRVDTLYTGPAIRNVVVQDTIYVSIGGSSISGMLGVVTRKNDLYGNIIETKYFADSMFWYHGVENSLKETGTGNYIIGGDRIYNDYSDNLLIKFDNNFDTIFTKRIYAIEDTEKEVVTYSSNIDVDSNYLLVGISNFDNNYELLPQPCMQLIKTDTLGNLLWRKLYGNSNFRHYGYKVVPAFNGGYLLGGWADTNGGDWALVKTDENGENPIFKYFGNIDYDDGKIMEITRTSDSCYIICGRHAIDGTIDKATILKLDSNLNIVWDKQYLNYASISFMFEAIEKSNGNFVVYGANKNSLGMTVSELMELTSEGNSLWKQTIAYDTVNSAYNYAYNAKITPDGGLIMTGKAFAPDQQMWLVKTDSMGCDGTEYTCDVSYLEEYASKESGLLLYPNPVKSTLFVEVKGEREKVKVSNPQNIAVIANPQGVAIPSTKQIAIPINRDRLSKALAMTLSKEQFQELPIQEKLKYNIAHPKQNYWGEKEEQEMRELSRQFAYAFPFEVIKGKVDIFSVDPALKAAVIARSTVIARKNSLSRDIGNEAISSTKQITSSYRPRNDVQEVSIYDIFGREVSRTLTSLRASPFLFDNNTIIDVSNLQSGVYFVKVGNSVAKFVKE